MKSADYGFAWDSMTNNRSIEIIAAALLTYILFASYSIVPLFGALFAVVSPLPLIIAYRRLGKAPFCLALALVTLLLGWTFAPELALLFVLSVGMLSAVTGEGLCRDVSMPRVVLWSTVLVISTMGILVAGTVITQGINPVASIQQYAITSLQETVKMYRELKMEPEQVDILSARIPLIADYFVRLFPALMLVTVGAGALLSYILSASILSRLGLLAKPMKPFHLWIVPDHLIWGVIAGGGLLLAPMVAAVSIGGNMLIPLLSIYMIQGLSIISFFFNKWQIHPLLRTLGYFLISTQLFFLLPVLSIGVFDTWADFRKLRKPASSVNEIIKD